MGSGKLLKVSTTGYFVLSIDLHETDPNDSLSEPIQKCRKRKMQTQTPAKQAGFICLHIDSTRTNLHDLSTQRPTTRLYPNKTVSRLKRTEDPLQHQCNESMQLHTKKLVCLCRLARWCDDLESSPLETYILEIRIQHLFVSSIHKDDTVVHTVNPNLTGTETD